MSIAYSVHQGSSMGLVEIAPMVMLDTAGWKYIFIEWQPSALIPLLECDLGI